MKRSPGRFLRKPWTVPRGLRAAGFAVLLLQQTVGAPSTLPGAQEDGFAAVLEPAFRQHCVGCHGKKGKAKGRVNLFALKHASDLERDPDLVGRLIEALELQEMPPEDEPLLEPAVRGRMVTELKAMLQTAVAANNAPAHTPIRRMNRFQYSNAVQDLFKLEVLVFPLPERMMREYDAYFQPATGKLPDKVRVGSRPLGKSQMIEPRLGGVDPFPQDLRAADGFDTQGDHLSLSPLLMESFLALSRSVVDSSDFNEKNCGIWETFFAPPPGDAEVSVVVRERLRRFLTRAFRRPVQDELLERYAGHVLSRIESGEPFTTSMKSAASAALASPRFLYLYEETGSGAAGESPGDYELASRLSFFLWGSIPDDELLSVAASGELSKPRTLQAQVDRMLGDRRLKRFCDSFPSQWLQLDRLVSAVPDPKKFPEFSFGSMNYRMSIHMMMEPLLLFEKILVEDRSIMELIDSDYSYRSERLVRWYAQQRPSGRGSNHFAAERVSVTDRREGGVITTAAILTMTSGHRESKPITRGAWVAGVIFNDPPDPPPADVPPLEEDVVQEKANLSLRERFKAHRDRPDCAGCHAKLDPLGFALENFNAIGRWREEYDNGAKVDPSGVLFRKHAFGNVVEFKDAILAEKDRFTRAFAGHLLSFALGRRVTGADRLALDEIARKMAEGGYRMRTLIHEITQSRPFLTPSSPRSRKRRL